VTVRANHAALLDLGDQLVARHDDSVSASEGEQLRAWIAMIEVHHVEAGTSLCSRHRGLVADHGETQALSVAVF
jgi:hypothetical protein